MLKQLKYFQSVVRLGSFSAAAEENFISQSAISQQVQSLERELGFALLVRKNRSFSLTPAGEYFYRKSLLLTAACDRMCAEAARALGDWDAEIVETHHNQKADAPSGTAATTARRTGHSESSSSSTDGCNRSMQRCATSSPLSKTASFTRVFPKSTTKFKAVAVFYTRPQCL